MSDFADARQIMANELMNDEGLYIAYRANVAMLLHDHHGITSVLERNKAADDILSLIFSIPPKDPTEVT